MWQLFQKLRQHKMLGASVVGGALCIGALAWWVAGRGDTTIGDAIASERFDAIDCQSRQFDSAPALALMFTTPLDHRQNFKDRLSVVDLGEAAQKPDQQIKKNSDTNAPTPLRDLSRNAGATGAAVSTAWVQGDNPRILYLPHATPKRRYRITLKADLASKAKETLGRDLVCEIVTDAMSPAFFFASKGTVLPAKQNGGLPIVTVNVTEVDVQFLRVEPAQLPRFMERVVGRRKNATNETNDSASESESDGDGDGDYYHGGSQRKPQGLVYGDQLDQLRKLSKSVYLGRFVTDARPNRRNITHLPVEDISELQQPGIYIAVMSEPGHFRHEFQTTYFYVSDIGIHVRRYANAIEAFSTSLRTGEAMSGVEFQLLDQNGKPLTSANADGNGHARLAVNTSQAKLIMAKRGAEFSLLSLIEPALDLSEFDTGGHLAKPVKIFAYTGRDLYRPGENFPVSVLVRDADGNPLPVATPAPITATLKRADGKTVQQFTLTVQDAKQAYYLKNINLPQDAQTGTWTLEFRADPAMKQADHVLKMNVEEFLPERMKLDLSTKQSYLARADTFVVDVKGDYLYGAPAAGNRVLSTLQTERARVPFPKEWPGFEFGDFDDNALKKREELPDATLADDGTASLSISVPKESPTSPLTLRATVSLLESGGRPVVRSIERILWPHERMIGVRPMWSGKFVREGAPAEIEVIRSNRQGKFMPLAKATMRVFREDRDYYWVFDDARGWHSGYNEGNELVESREFDLTQRAKLSFPVKWGRYRIEIADRETGAVMRYRFYAGWGAEDAELIGSRPDRVQMKLDKSAYKAGDSIKLTLTPPHDGEALILVEGDQMLYQRRTAVSASGTTVSIPVDKSWNRHDLYISAVVFRPGVRQEKITPARALGITYLPLDRESRRLTVKLDAPAKIEPESTLKIKVKVNGLSNESGMVTISAVDVGILNITRFATPDAFDFFMGKQRYQPDALDLYGKFIETMEGQKGRLKFGGDANLRGAKKSPQKVKLVDLFSGPVALNAQGEGMVELKLPDFNGTLKLMAVAASPTRFGKAETEVVSAAAIVAELATPRFIAHGDRAAVALDVTNMTEATQTFSVRVSTRGALKINGGSENIILKPQQKRTMRMSAEATDAAGEGVITVDVKNAVKQKGKQKGEQIGERPLSIKRESLLVIAPLQPQERIKRFVRVSPGETSKLDAMMLEGYFANSALMSVTLSGVPPLNVHELVKGLFSYPYGCLEQTTSRAFPHVLLDDATAQSFGLKLMERSVREKAIADAISRLSGMQRASGAYTLWGDGPDEPWLTAYVTDFLKTAREAGYAVPESMPKRADEWMLKQLQQAGNSFPTRVDAARSNAPEDAISRDSAWWNDARRRENGREAHRRLGALAYMGYVLAREERAPLSALRLLHDEYRDRALSPLPMVHLGLALQRMGDAKRAQTAFDRAMSTPYGMTGHEWEWLGDYGTRLRDSALAYALLERHKITHPRRENLLGELMSMVPKAQWLSTQEQLSLLLAARSFTGIKTERWRATISESAKTEILESRATEMREYNATAIKRGVTIANKGAAPLYIAVEATGYPLKARESKEDVIQLRRTLYNGDGSPVGDRTLKVGEQLLVHLEVNANRRVEDGLVVDRVPAGLEIENLNLSQGNRLADFKTPTSVARMRSATGMRQPKEIAESLSDSRVKHREFRDDRFVAAAKLEGMLDLYYLVRVVTPGQFVVPPSFAEDMYRPELRALTHTGGSITVVDRK